MGLLEMHYLEYSVSTTWVEPLGAKVLTSLLSPKYDKAIRQKGCRGND